MKNSINICIIAIGTLIMLGGRALPAQTSERTMQLEGMTFWALEHLDSNSVVRRGRSRSLGVVGPEELILAPGQRGE